MRYAPNHRPNAYMKNMAPNKPPLAKEMRHWFFVACASASPRFASYRLATALCAFRAVVTRAAPMDSVAIAPAFSYAGFAWVKSVVARIRKYVARPRSGTPARITSESFHEK